MARARSALIGREADARALRGMVEAGATLVLVSGDAGVGKSRLVSELVPERGRRLVGSCLPLRHAITLLPFREMFSPPDLRPSLLRAVSTMPAGLVEGLRPFLPEE